MAMRSRPLWRSREKSRGWPGAAVGQTAPSTAESKGSWPAVAWKICSARAALRPIPFSARWQVAQARPLVPRDWKQGPLWSNLPLALFVSTKPVWSWKGNRLGRDAATTAAAVNTGTAQAISDFRALLARILRTLGLGIRFSTLHLRFDTPNRVMC